MGRKKILVVLVAMLTVLLALQATSVGATSWRTKANVTSKGVGSWYSSAVAGTDVNKPYAIRFGFATPNGVSKTITVDWEVNCENTSKSGTARLVTTPTDGSFKWVTPYAGSTSLGRVCQVYVWGDAPDATKLRLRIQAKHP